MLTYSLAFCYLLFSGGKETPGRCR